MRKPDTSCKAIAKQATFALGRLNLAKLGEPSARAWEAPQPHVPAKGRAKCGMPRAEDSKPQPPFGQ